MYQTRKRSWFFERFFLARKKRKIYHVEQFRTNDGGGKSRSNQNNSAQLKKSFYKVIVLKGNYVYYLLSVF